mgnify:CR=1 FL=1
MKLKKILCAVLALAMLAGCASSFVGCGKKQVAEKQVVDHVYRATYLERPKDLNYVQRMFVQDDYVYMYGEHYDRETYESEMRLFRMGLDGSNVTRLDMPGVQIGEDSYLQEMLMVPDGSVWQVVHTSHYNEETYEYFEEYHIYHVAAHGTVLADVNPKDIWDRQAEDPENGAESGIYHYIHSCMLLGGGFVFQDSDRTLYRLSGDGQLVAEIPGEGNDLHGALLSLVQFSQIMQCGIFASVVDKDDFIIITAAFKGTDDSFLESSHIFCFIIAGDY